MTDKHTFAVVAAAAAVLWSLTIRVSSFCSPFSSATTRRRRDGSCGDSFFRPDGGASSPSPLFANSKNIRAAMEATEKFGISSPEARLAWEVVEEFDARTNDSAAYETTTATATTLTQDQLNAAYEELNATMELMNRNPNAVSSFRNNQILMKDVAAELHAIKLRPPERKPAPKIPGLWDAKLKARATSQIHGNDSTEAKLAWEEVEEIASSGLSNALGGGVYSTDNVIYHDLEQAAEACMALEELDRFLYLEHEKYSNGNNEDTYSDNNDYYDVDNYSDEHGGANQYSP